MEQETSSAEYITVDYRLGKGWKWMAYTLVGVLIYQLITLQRPGFGELKLLFAGKIGAYLHSLLLYYFLFELISVFIFIRLSDWYLYRIGMHRFKLSLPNLLKYQLMFLPLILGSIFVFGPITNTVRYLVLFFPDYTWHEYFPEYFFTGRMYINYMVPYLIFGFALLNVNLFLNYYDWQKAKIQELANRLAKPDEQSAYIQTIEAHDGQGEALLPVNEVWWFEVEGKNYKAYTQGKTYDMRLTLSELEQSLNPAVFFRVNRACIVNLKFVKNYSFWENDKYILRMVDDKTEFVMQRARLKLLKSKIP